MHFTLQMNAKTMSHLCNALPHVPYLSPVSLLFMPSLSKAFQEKVGRGGKYHSATLDVTSAVKLNVLSWTLQSVSKYGHQYGIKGLLLAERKFWKHLFTNLNV